MGSCGCGDFDDVRWAVTVGKYVLCVMEYDGCNNGCDAPLGFTLMLMTKTEAKNFGIKPTGEWKPEETVGWSEQFLNFFSQSQLVEATRQLTRGVDAADYDDLGDAIDESALEIMRNAWSAQQAFENELRKRFGEKPPFAPSAHRD